jgi:hypothetical protein
MREAKSIHCGDLAADRSLGDYWEQKFCELLPPGAIFYRHQKNKSGSSVYAEVKADGSLAMRAGPDVTVWNRGAAHHEIKHKNAYQGKFGLEQYRYTSLVRFAERTGERVFYTIHDHGMCGGRDTTVNHINHWLSCNVLSLGPPDDAFPCPTWKNGIVVKEMTLFWHRSQFSSLRDLIESTADFCITDWPMESFYGR